MRTASERGCRTQHKGAAPSGHGFGVSWLGDMDVRKGSDGRSLVFSSPQMSRYRRAPNRDLVTRYLDVVPNIAMGAQWCQMV